MLLISNPFGVPPPSHCLDLLCRLYQTLDLTDFANVTAQIHELCVASYCKTYRHIKRDHQLSFGLSPSKIKDKTHLIKQ